MSRTLKAGKRSKLSSSAKQHDVFCAVMQRRHWGSTEKILRRNRKTWTRLGNKRRRRADKEASEA